MARGRLIVFEGGEGVGKTTQLERLALRLGRHGIEARRLREPGGTAVGDEIRSLLLRPGMNIPPRTEALLFMASRAALVVNEIQPTLERGEWVLLDRFSLSTLAYQVYGRGLDFDAVHDANQFAVAGLVPDLNVILTLPEGEGLRRAAQRGAADRMEQAHAQFHANVAAAFGRFAAPSWSVEHSAYGPVVAVDAAGSVDDVESRIWRVVESACPEVQN